VVPVRYWNGDGPARNMKPRTATFLGGVARKHEAPAHMSWAGPAEMARADPAISKI
jgi:hypothetical protein